MSVTGDDRTPDPDTSTGDPDAPTPPFGFPAPRVRPRRSHRKLWLSLLAAGLVVVVLAAGYTVVRYVLDLGSYNDGHEAYQRADCAAALGHFDDVINGWRIVELGGAVGRAGSEKAECLVFQEAVDRQQAGHASGALAAYVLFLPGRPASPLTEAARGRVAELFSGPDLARLATVESCDTLPALREQRLLDAKVAAAFHAACGAAYNRVPDKTKAVATYARLFADFGTDKVATDTEAELVKDTGWCGVLDQFRNDPVLAARDELLPGLLNTCAKAPPPTTTVAAAITLAEEFLKKYPGHRLTPEVLATYAQRINQLARISTRTGEEVGPAQLIRTVGGGKAVLLVHNDSDQPLRIALSGPDPRVEVIDACPSCPDVTEAGNRICRDQATLKRIELAPGEYDMSVDSPESTATAPGYAHWVLQPGKEYFACYSLFPRAS